MNESNRGNTTEGENVLLQIPAMKDDDTEHYELLADGNLAQTDLLVVSYHQTPDSWLRSWLDCIGHRPAGFGFIHVGGATRSAAAAQSSTSSAPSPPTITAVGNPGDLTGLGIRISEYLDDWNENEHRTRLWFDSITSLLQYTDDVETAFKFIHVLVGRTRTARAAAFYKIIPDAHSDQTIVTMSSLFDRAIEYSDIEQP